jgi:hypothetical protein
VLRVRRIRLFILADPRRHLRETRDLSLSGELAPAMPTDLDHGGINLSIRCGFGLPVQT